MCQDSCRLAIRCKPCSKVLMTLFYCLKRRWGRNYHSGTCPTTWIYLLSTCRCRSWLWLVPPIKWQLLRGGLQRWQPIWCTNKNIWIDSHTMQVSTQTNISLLHQWHTNISGSTLSEWVSEWQRQAAHCWYLRTQFKERTKLDYEGRRVWQDGSKTKDGSR